MGSYALNINAGVTGVDQVDRLGAATDKQAERTRRVDEAIRSYAANNEKLNAKLLDIEKSEIRLDQLREQHRMQTERLAATTDKHTASQERLNEAHRHAVTDVQAASASIRAMEGNLPIRAVEQFTTKILGMGAVFQFAFPIVGAIAMVEALDKGAEKLGLHLAFWKEIGEAQKESTEELKRAGREYDSILEKIISLQRQERRRSLIAANPKTGAILADQAEQFDYSFDARTRDQQTVERLQREIAAIRKVTNLGVYDSISGEDARFAALGGMKGVVEGNLPSPWEIEAGKQMLPGLEGKLQTARLEIEQKIAQAKASGAKADEGIERNREEAARKVAAIEEHILDLRKKAEEAAMRSYFGNSLEGKAAYDQVRLRIEEADAVRKYGHADQIGGYYTVLRSAAYGENADAIAKRNDREIGELDSVSRTSLEHYLRETRKETKNEDQSFQDLLRPKAPPPPPGYRTAPQELRDVRDSERRYMSLERVSAQLSGQSERDQIDGQYGARLRFAEQEYQAELRLADLKKTDGEKEAARADALDQKHQKVFDAQIEREKAILEMTLRVKQEFERNFVGLVHAVASGNLGGFVKSRLESLGDEVLKKIGGKIFDEIRSRAGNKTVSIPDVLGGAAKDPIDSTNQNTRATDDNTKAIRDLTSVLVSGGGGGGFGGGGGGIGTIGFPNGSGGPGVMGGSSSTIMYGFPGSGSPNSKTMSTVGKAANYAGAAYLGYQGVSSISHGGARNVAGGISEVAMAAAMVDPEPVSKAILAGVALAAGVVGSLLPDPKAERQRAVNNALSFGRYVDPVSINASMTTYGGYADYDRFGGIRGSDLSPFPIINEPYIDHARNVTVPGRTASHFGGGPPPTVNIYAMDGADVRRVLYKHSDTLGDAVVHTINRGHVGLQETLRDF